MAIQVKAFFVFIALLFTGLLQAQNAPLPSVDFDCQDCTPAQALVQLARQTGINIVFSDRFFSQCPPVRITVQATPLLKIVDQISACSKATYQVMDGQIVFFRKNPRYTFSGYVQDAETGERILGASIRILNEKGGGAISNEFGFYSIRLEEGTYNLLVSYLGYRREPLQLVLNADQFMTIKLQPDNTLREIVILGSSPDSAALRHNHVPLNLSLSGLKNLPMPGGEADLLRQAALQAGVQTGVDGLGGLNVRGGNADQNLILLDDVPVYNPSHALGLFSIFNTATVSSAQLWKGDFPARYAGRVSSVLDVRTRDGNFRKYRAQVSTGLFAASGTLEGPVIKEKMALLVGFRTTYFEPWVRFFSKRGNLLNFSGDKVSYGFYDMNAKLTFVATTKDRFYLSFYQGSDNFRNQYDQLVRRTEGVYTNQYTLNSVWGNTIAALRWNRVIHSNLFSNTTLRYSRFIYQSTLGFQSTLLSTATGRETTEADYAQLYQTLIRDVSLKTDFTRYFNPNMTLRWGGNYTRHIFQPGTIQINFLQPGQSPSSIDSISRILTNNELLNAVETEVYIDAEMKPFKNWMIEAGVNGSAFLGRQSNYGALQPRFRLQHTGSKGWSQWAGFHRHTQYLHQIGSFNISLPFELWVPSTRKVPPERVWQGTFGLGWRGAGWNTQLEAYYKKFERVLSFVAVNDVLLNGGAEDASGWEDRITGGTGRSTGIEFLLEKTTGPTTGSIAYTLSESTRQFPALNSGKVYPFRFDRRHDLKINLHQRLFRWLSADAVWSFATGNPITLGSVKYTHQTPGGDQTQVVYIFTAVNNYRLPLYHRLDVALNGQFTHGRLQHGFQLGVYNAYNRANPSYILLDLESGVKGKATQYTLLPLLPVFRYEVKYQF